MYMKPTKIPIHIMREESKKYWAKVDKIIFEEEGILPPTEEEMEEFKKNYLKELSENKESFDEKKFYEEHQKLMKLLENDNQIIS